MVLRLILAITLAMPAFRLTRPVRFVSVPLDGPAKPGTC